VVQRVADRRDAARKGDPDHRRADPPAAAGSRREPWIPGVNAARCSCGTSDRLHFEWSVVDGRRILEPAPLHAAPDEHCSCGLYSLRRPAESWHASPGVRSGKPVVGAVASWGRLQVHGTGVRAEHACVVALAVPDAAEPGVVEVIERAARRYGVDAVRLADLEASALEHGDPLPDELHRAAVEPSSPAAAGPSLGPQRKLDLLAAPDATVDEVGGDPPGRPRRRLARRHVGLALLALLAALIVGLIVFAHRSTPCKLQILNVEAGGTIERCLPASPAHR
jgi:hypothetical protein